MSGSFLNTDLLGVQEAFSHVWGTRTKDITSHGSRTRHGSLVLMENNTAPFPHP